MRVFIVDDRNADITDLKNKLIQINSQIQIKFCQDPFEAVDILKKTKFDAVFLDIEMPGMSGLEIAESHLNDETPIIICSSFPEYAVDSAKFRPFDYLLKPVLPKKLKYALLRIEEYYSNNKNQQKIQFQTGKSKYVHCRVCDILYFEAWGDYQKMHTTEGKHLIIETMDELTEKMSLFNFIRIHRKYLVNHECISEIHPKYITINNIDLPIGRFYKKNLKKEYA